MPATAFKSALLASIAASGLLVASAVQAQAVAATDADASTNDAEIIVTASKRAATLQDTPISVAVTTAASIEQSQIRDLKDLQTLVPSLTVNQLQSSANTNFSIRGFGNGANNAGIEPSVGVFIDGVYRSRSAAQIGDLPNIERVEVLRGPQSTLFGKNASAGIISIITAEPKFKLGANAELSYGNYNAVVAKASVTAPLTDTIAFSLAGNYNRRDGYGQDLAQGIKVNNRNRWGVRGQLLFKPSEDFKLRLIADYDNINENCCIVANLVNGPTAPAIFGVGGRPGPIAPFSFTENNNFPSINKIKNFGVSLENDWNINDKFSLTTIGSYRGVRSLTNQDSDFTSADLIGENKNNTRINTYTLESRLATNFDGPLNFLAGVYYFREDIKINADLLYGKDFRNYASLLGGNIPAGIGLPPGPAYTLLERLGVAPAGTFGAKGQGRFENYSQKDRSLSIFGQADFTPVEGLTLTAGGNYTDDRKRVSSNDYTTDVFSTINLASIFGANSPLLGLTALQFLPPFLNFPNSVESGRTKDTNFSYTLRAAYKFSGKLNTYFTYATGFKPTSWNLSYDSRPVLADLAALTSAGLTRPNQTTGSRFAGPEKSEVFEAGLKGNFEGFSFNLAIFKQTIRGFQTNIFTGTGFVLGNAAKESTRGIELDTVLSPTRDISFNFNLTYLDPKYDSFPGASTFTPTFGVVSTDLSGKTPAGIPKFSIAVGTNLKHQFSDNVKGLLHIDYNVSSTVQLSEGLPQYRTQAESLNSTATITIRDNIDLSVWGRNLTDAQYITTIFPTTAQPGSLSGYPSQPRTFGVSARMRY